MFSQEKDTKMRSVKRVSWQISIIFIDMFTWQLFLALVFHLEKVFFLFSLFASTTSRTNCEIETLNKIIVELIPYIIDAFRIVNAHSLYFCVHKVTNINNNDKSRCSFSVRYAFCSLLFFFTQLFPDFQKLFWFSCLCVRINRFV